ncbi:MAG: TolC family protein [Desulfovibrionaceae bacterium]|nr:TolC family protein [Desulfovibrionaceae bacterium]
MKLCTLRRAPRCLILSALLALSAGLSGCGGRGYEMPPGGLLSQSEVEEGWMVDRAWWKAYNDPVLDSLVDTALAANVDLAKSGLAVRRALFQARQAGAELWPEPSAGGSAGSRLNTQSGESFRSYGASFDIGYELDLWRRLSDAAAARDWEYRASEEDRESVRLTLINRVINAYYQLQYLRATRELTRRSLDFYEELFRIVSDKFRAGKVDGLEPVTAEQSVLAARASLTDLETQIGDTEQSLRDLLNRRPDTNLDIPSVDLLKVRPPRPNPDVPLSVLGLRPDVRAAEYRVQESFSDWQADKASLYPSISLGGGLSASSDSADNLFRVPFLAGTVSLRLPFLQWNTLRWRLRISETQFEERRLDFAKTLTTALNEVDGYWRGWRNAVEQLDTMKKKHEADVRIAAYRERRYQLGADELRDWVQALNTANDSMQSVIRGAYTVIEHVNAVFQAMGGRFMPRREKPEI